MKVLITGGAGFVGSNLARYCLDQQGVEVTVMDSLEPRLEATRRWLPPEGPRFRFIHASLLDPEVAEAAVRNQDVIFNCAGQSSHSLSRQDPFFDVQLNCVASLNLLEAVRSHAPEAVLVYLSTSTQIGAARDEIIDENHVERPRDIYSANKGVAEKYHRIYHLAYGLKTVSIRLANLFGPFGKGSSQFGVLNYFIHLARDGKTIPLFDTAGAQLRNALYVEDACSALWAAAQTPDLYGDAVFAVHAEHRTLREIVEAIIDVMQSGELEVTPEPASRRGMEVGDQHISGARFQRATGWSPRYGLREGLARTKAIMDEEMG